VRETNKNQNALLSLYESVYTAAQRFASLVAANPAQFYENRFAIKYRYSWRP
jgi:hypothetical protein